MLNLDRSYFVIIFCIVVLIDNSNEKSIKKSHNFIDNLIKDSHNRIQMGTSLDGCDNGESHLDMDWDESPINYTCYHPKNFLPILTEVKSVEECDHIPSGYFPQHYCMDDEITYNTTLPTHGDHRPLWPIYGEYKFVPKQRWLHNIEHGAIVMLYHSCTNPAMVNRLRAIVMNCLRKHVITRYNEIDTSRPLVLIGWGCRLRMNYVDYDTVVSFIKRVSMKGPEGNYPKEGQYSKHLLRIAKPPHGSNYNDSVICPNM